MSAKDYLRTIETTVEEFEKNNTFRLSEGQRWLLESAKKNGQKIKVSTFDYPTGRFLHQITLVRS